MRHVSIRLDEVIDDVTAEAADEPPEEFAHYQAGKENNEPDGYETDSGILHAIYLDHSNQVGVEFLPFARILILDVL